MTTPTKIDYDAVVALTREGCSARQIAEQLGCTSRSVVRIRQLNGIVVRPHAAKFSDDEKRRAAAMLDDGCSIYEVARTLGRDKSTIRAHFPGRGWTPSQIGEWAAVRRHEMALT